MTADEFISGMRKGDKLIPVITIIVYYGTDKSWDGARTLYELLDMDGMEEEIIPFISDYQLNVFDHHEHDNFGQFHSELQSVFEFLRYAGDKKALGERMVKNKEKYRRLSSQAKALLAHLTNIKKIPNVKEEELERGEFDMCKAFEDMKEEGRLEGKIEGRAEGRAEEIVESGYEFKLSESEILERLQNRLNISLEAAQGYFAMFKMETV